MTRNDCESQLNIIEPSKCKWENRLTDYNNYVKEYIKHYKKSKKGNVTSTAKYPYMREKSEILCERLSYANNHNLLKDKQIRKVLKINLKLINACIE